MAHLVHPEKLDGLAPGFRRKCLAIADDLGGHGFTFFVVRGLASFEEQNRLYQAYLAWRRFKQGLGSEVPFAPLAGNPVGGSLHPLGLAADLAFDSGPLAEDKHWSPFDMRWPWTGKPSLQSAALAHECRTLAASRDFGHVEPQIDYGEAWAVWRESGKSIEAVWEWAGLA